MLFLKRLLFIFGWICIMSGSAQAAALSIACAANFTGAMKELTALYEKETGIKTGCAFGATGMLYGQITNGAPYDLFFAADEDRPALLHKAGLAATPILYASGRVVLWSSKTALTAMPSWKEAILSPEIIRVGIANPKTAPYGKNAYEALAASGLLGIIKPKLAYGKNVSTAFQYAYSEAADIAFIALSQTLSEEGAGGTYWYVPEAQPVKQAACVLNGEHADMATDFIEWIQSPAARTIIKRNGYE